MLAPVLAGTRRSEIVELTQVSSEDLVGRSQLYPCLAHFVYRLGHVSWVEVYATAGIFDYVDAEAEGNGV